MVAKCLLTQTCLSLIAKQEAPLKETAHMLELFSQYMSTLHQLLDLSLRL